jgi:acetyl/propionyl-CoA carboxylase alpha subunit
MTDKLCKGLSDAAKAAEFIKYEGAGTVESCRQTP